MERTPFFEAHPSTAFSARLEHLVERFELSLFRGDDPLIEDFLPEDVELQTLTLLELIHIEIEYRLKSGHGCSLEEYRDRFPILAELPHEFAGLIVAEMSIRRRNDPTIEPGEYVQRFPQLADAIAQALAKVGNDAGEIDTHSQPFAGVKTLVSTKGSHESLGEADELEIGSQLGDYDVLARIGDGGMGVVYRVRQRSLQRILALKVMRGATIASSEMKARFHQEARTAARLRHPNIISIHEVGREDDRDFFTMDFIEGNSLWQKVFDSPIAARVAASYLQEAARAVQFAHERGVIHRDIKPANLLVDGLERVIVTDFGLAWQTESDIGLTETGDLIGTPVYVAPECVVNNDSQRTPQADIYSWGPRSMHASRDGRHFRETQRRPC